MDAQAGGEAAQEHGRPAAALQETGGAVQRATQIASSEELTRLERRLPWLATTGAVTPFIGLFGTVVGILVAFQSMAVMGTGGFSVVAAGISEALISTALGLIVAIIAVIFYNYFSQRIERINATIHICAARLIDAAETGRKLNGH